LQLIRYLLPPLYFLFPLDTLFICVILLKNTLYEAVLMWQCVTCTVSILGFFILRNVYGGWATRALENKEIEYFKEIRDLLEIFDGHWRTRFDEASILWQTIYISSFFNAEFFSAYIGLFWMSVRGKMKPYKKLSADLTFIWSCILGFVLETPAAVIQFRLISNAIDSLENSKFEVFKEFTLFELLPYFILTGFATCVIQWNNISALVNRVISCCCGRKDTGTNSKGTWELDYTPTISISFHEGTYTPESFSKVPTAPSKSASC